MARTTSVAENHHLDCSSSHTALTSRLLKKRIDFLLYLAMIVFFSISSAKDSVFYWYFHRQKSTFSVRSKQNRWKSKQFPSEVYVLRKRVNLSSESSQLYSGEAVNQIRMDKQVLKKRSKKESTIFRKRQPVGCQMSDVSSFLRSWLWRENLLI